jgi:hypothetical protein
MRHVTAMFLAAAVAAVTACGDSSPASPSGPGGTLNVRITDAPFDDAKAVLVTFSEVSAHRAETPDSAWSTLPFADGATTRTCDLKKLQNAREDVLGVGVLTAGHYTQVRLTVASARLYFDNESAGPACAPAIPAPTGNSAPVEVSSGQVRLNRQFTIGEGGATTMLLDFDGGASIREQGNGQFRMTPVIAVVSVQ